MRARLALLFLCACSGGTRLSQAREPWLKVQGDAGVDLVLGGPGCPTLSDSAHVTLNGDPGTVLHRGGKAGGCQTGCTDALVRWPQAAPRMEFQVNDDGRSLRTVVDGAAPTLAFALAAADGGVLHAAFGAPLPLRWEPQVPVERLRVELKNPALMWRGGRPVLLCGPGKCVLPGADAGEVLLTVPRSAMPGHSGLTATALFAPRVEQCVGAASCAAELPLVNVTATGAVLIEP